MSDVLSNKIVSIRTYNNDYINKIDEVVDDLFRNIENYLSHYNELFRVVSTNDEDDLTSEGVYYLYFECSGNVEDFEEVWLTIKEDIENIIGYEKVGYHNVVSYYDYDEGEDTYPHTLFSIDVVVPSQYFEEYIGDTPMFVD